MSVRIYVEGGGDSKDLRIKCQEGFRKWTDKIQLAKKPRIVASGSRDEAFDKFKTALSNLDEHDVVLLWVDSEDMVDNQEETWPHLKSRDNWDCPKGAHNEHVLLMVTCMETWLIVDQSAVRIYCGEIQKSAFPSNHGIESKDRHLIHDLLKKATRGKFEKGRESFKLLALSDPQAIRKHCKSADRAVNILQKVCR